MQENVASANKRNLVEVLFSDDAITAYVKLAKPREDEAPITKEDMMHALSAAQVTFGIREDILEKLAARPIYGIRIEVGKAQPPEDGEDGSIIYHVQRDSEYQPEFKEEGNIDYKNVDYFQMAEKGQILCEVIKEKEGIPGFNVFGGQLPARMGKRPPNPAGNNTVWNEDETILSAAVDGQIHFSKDRIDISETMNIRSDVNNLTGNINFPGEVVIDGDVSDGFSVVCGGGLIVKGVVEGAKIEAGGDIHIAKGINGGGRAKLAVGGDLYSPYIEGSSIKTSGNIFADYIVSSDVICDGNIELKGKRELIIGGNIRLRGELTAKDIGNEREHPTRIEILSTAVDNNETIRGLEAEKQKKQESLGPLQDAEEKYRAVLNSASEAQLEAYEKIKEQTKALTEQIGALESTIKKEKASDGFAYLGGVTCKRKLYQGVDIHIADQKFRFSFDNIEHCRIYWNEGEIVQSTL